jgi:Uma2 family endonuclease
MGLHEIVLPNTEPETEWVRGRPLQKVSATRSHALLQGALVSWLRAWAGSHGEVGTEWRFRIAPPGAVVRPLVPDISYVAVERLRGLSGHDLEVPQLSPDVAVEILSPDDRRIDVDDKTATYLAAGSLLVIIIDPQAGSVELHDGKGTQTFRRGQTIRHQALPGFSLSISELFETIAPPR